MHRLSQDSTIFLKVGAILIIVIGGDKDETAVDSQSLLQKLQDTSLKQPKQILHKSMKKGDFASIVVLTREDSFTPLFQRKTINILYFQLHSRNFVLTLLACEPRETYL